MLEKPDFATLALGWLTALSHSLDVVVIAEHFDESLLLLGRELGASHQDLVYISQKRRKAVKAASGHRAVGQSPAAVAALSPTQLANVSQWPSTTDLTAPDAAWLWPHELDAALRGNWLDSLAYMYFNDSLWRRIDSHWPGEAGRVQFGRELESFRTLRAGVKAGCAQCEQRGVAQCLAHAKRAASAATPHMCWTLRQVATRRHASVALVAPTARPDPGKHRHVPFGPTTSHSFVSMTCYTALLPRARAVSLTVVAVSRRTPGAGVSISSSEWPSASTRAPRWGLLLPRLPRPPAPPLRWPIVVLHGAGGAGEAGGVGGAGEVSGAVAA